VLLWLKRAQQAGSFREGSLQLPSPRESVANAVYHAIRKSMRGSPEPVIERAIQQARQQADLLYQLIVKANAAILEYVEQSHQYSKLLARFALAVAHGTRARDELQGLRQAIEPFIEEVLVLEGAALQITAERLDGQDVLFQDAADALKEWIDLAKLLTDRFNLLARSAGLAEIDLENVRTRIRCEVDRQVSSWVDLGRIEMLITFGEGDAWHTALDRFLRSATTG